MRVEAIALRGIPEVRPSDDLAALIAAAGTPLADGDILVVAQKIVSKAEDRAVALADVRPGERARELAAQTQKDPRLVQVILDESRAVLRAAAGVLIVETRHGFVCANAGVDASNVPGDDVVLRLPVDADASARGLRDGLRERCGVSVGIVISDSFGRAWRCGQQDVAIGCAGLAPLADMRGERDSQGRELTASMAARADELASAANLVRGKADGTPVALIRGRRDLVTAEHGPGAAALLRERAQDLFR